VDLIYWSQQWECCLQQPGEFVQKYIYCFNALANPAKVKDSNSRGDRLIQGFIPELKFSILIRADGLSYESLIQMCIKFEHKFTPDPGRLMAMQQQHNTWLIFIHFLFPPSASPYDTLCGSASDYVSSTCTNTNPTSAPNVPEIKSGTNEDRIVNTIAAQVIDLLKQQKYSNQQSII
jgi:hypothetical protein